MLDKSENFKRGESASKKKPSCVFKRLNTIREKEEESKSNKSDFNSQNSQNRKGRQSNLAPKSAKSDKGLDENLVTVSSYQMSVGDETLEESSHNMHDKYYRPLVPVAYRNPLAKNES